MKRFLSVISFALLLPIAGYADRSSTNVDFTIGPVFSVGTSASGSNGSGLDIDDGIGFGLGFAYHLNERFALGFETAYIEPDYELRINTDDDGVRVLDHEMTIASFQFNGIWHLFEGSFTPYLQGGFGWTNVDSNVSDGRPETGCWWDPWWGYVCADFYSTYNETEFSYNAAVGLRYEFGNDRFLKGSYGYQWLDADTDADAVLESFRIELGFRF